MAAAATCLPQLWQVIAKLPAACAEQTDGLLRLEGLSRSDDARMINDRYVNGEIEVDEMVRQTIALHSRKAPAEFCGSESAP